MTDVLTRPQNADEFLYSGDDMNGFSVMYSGHSTDVLDQTDTVSLEDLYDEENDQMRKAGIDDMTPVDTFLEMQGGKSYVTDL